MSYHFGLAEEDIQKINSVFLKYTEITKVVIYGSRAKGDFKASSSIDLSIFTDKKDISFLSKVSKEINDLGLPYKTDMSINSLLENESLKNHIKLIGQSFFQR